MKKRKKKGKCLFRSSRKGGKVRKLKRLQKIEEPEEDRFVDENTVLPDEHPEAVAPHEPDEYVVREVLSDLEGFREWQRDITGPGLNYGDY